MSDRTVKVLLSAQVNGYLSGMDQAKRKTQEVTASAQDQSDALRSLGSTAAVAVAAIGVAAAAMATLAVVQFAKFDKAMSNVKAATQESARGMGELRDAALQAGTNTQYSATQAAEAIAELGKAGLTTSDILSGGLSASLNLAASDNLDLATAAGIAATTAKQFGLEGKDLAHVSDLLAAGANKALGGVEDLANGLKFVGPVAHSMGISVDETTAALASFAGQGILGEQAGTSLRGVLSSLTSPSNQAKAQLDALNVTLYDGQGKFLGLANMAGQLENAYKGMSDEQRDASLGVIFGNQQITAARLLYQQGAKGIEEWTAAVNDQGFAAKVAAQQMDNLEGDVTKLGNAFNVSLIKAGSASNDVLRGLVQMGTDLVKSFADAPPAVQATILAVVVLTAGLALLAGATAFLVPKIYETAVALNVLSTSSIPGVAAAATGLLVATRGLMAGLATMSRFLMGPWGIALGVAVLSLAALSKTMSSGAPNAEAMANALMNTANAAQLLKVASTQDGASKFFWGDYADSLKDLPGLLNKINNDGFDFFNLSFNDQGGKSAVERLGEAFGNLARQDLPAAQSKFEGLTEQYKLNKSQQVKLLETMPVYKAALIETATALGINVTTGTAAENSTRLLELAMGKGAAAAKKQAVVLGDVGAAAEDTTGLVEDLSKAISDFGKTQFDVNSTTRAFEQAIDDASAAVAENGRTLDVNTQKGRDNQTALDDIASSANQVAAAIYAQTGSMEGVSEALARGREQYILTGVRMGLTREEAEKYADALIATPGAIATQVTLNTDPATLALNRFIADITSRKPTLYIEGRVVRSGDPQYRASGGTIGGVGTSKSDSNLAYLSKGEEVIQEPYASRFRPQLKAMNMGHVPTFANGGTFTPAPARAATSGMSQSAVTPAVYVQNPFTGEYLLAQVDNRAHGVLTSAINQAIPDLAGRK